MGGKEEESAAASSAMTKHTKSVRCLCDDGRRGGRRSIDGEREGERLNMT